MSNVKLYTELDIDTEMITTVQGTTVCQILNGVTCSEPRFVPIENWTNLSKSEFDNIISTSIDKDIYQTIGLIKLDEKIISDHNLNSLRYINDPNENVQNRTSIENAIGEYCKSYQILPDDIQNILGIHIRNSSKISSTYDNDTKTFIGLHIDSWFNTEVEKRHLSKNRICFNLGLQDRYIVFSNIPIFKIFKSLNSNEILNAKTAVSRYLNSNRQIALYKLRVRPFEGYIFPTENLIHDGRCYNDDQIDITFTTISYFQTFKNNKNGKSKN